MENLSYVGSPSGLMNYIKSFIPSCSICKDKGYTTRTEWSDENGRDIDYDIEARCVCAED